jgi:putative spermidine/putrescine transport system permease protein
MLSWKRNSDLALTAGVVGTIVLTTIFLAFPVFVTTFMAFDARDYLGEFPPTRLSTKWFAQFVGDDYLWAGLKTSLLVAAGATAISSVIGALAALAISRMPPGRRDFVTSLFLSPLVLPAVILGFALLMFFAVVSALPSFPRLMAGHLLIAIPYTIRMTLIGLAGISPSLREAALSLGANERQAFLTVTLPLAKNAVAAGAVFAFAFSMDDVAISLFLSDFNTYTLPVALISLMRSKFDLTLAAAGVILILLTVLLLIVLDRVLGLEKVIGQGVYRV